MALRGPHVVAWLLCRMVLLRLPGLSSWVVVRAVGHGTFLTHPVLAKNEL